MNISKKFDDFSKGFIRLKIYNNTHTLMQTCSNCLEKIENTGGYWVTRTWYYFPDKCPMCGYSQFS